MLDLVMIQHDYIKFTTLSELGAESDQSDYMNNVN